jgi:predicted acyltransferase
MATTVSPVTASTVTPARPAAPASQARSVSLDAYRGLIMIFLVSAGFGFGALKDHPVWGAVAHQVDHVPWGGMVLWDLIQPAFMFMVGVALPYSMAQRAAAGFWWNFGHVARRALILVFLSQLFTVVHSGQFQFGLINVLSQIAFTYTICFLIMHLPVAGQVVSAAALLAGHWALFVAFPGPQGPFSQTGNVGQVIDQWLLGRNYPGLYVTINFISSTVTTLAGVWAGLLLRSPRPQLEKLKLLAISAAACLAGGMALALVNPMVKRIWTASFTIYSLGWVLAGLAACYWLVDIRGNRRLVFPLVVVGMNSIFAYCVSQLMRGSIHRSVGVFTGRFEWVGELAPVLHACATLAVIWYLCWWLYQRKLFIKV